MKKIYFSALGIFLMGFLATSNSYAQVTEPKYEVGIKLNVLDIRKINEEKPLGFGGFIGYNLNKNVSLEGEIAHFPKDPSGNFGETIGMFGVKAGIRTKINSANYGFFLKFRPGFIKFDNNFAAGNLTRPFYDVGTVFEYYPFTYLALRADVGAAIIPFGDNSVRTVTGESKRPGITTNLNASFGIAIRF